jgi:hypothetical protein
MNIFGIEIFALLGFILAAYSIVANDAIQTLGTFLSSNSQRHWTILWVYACSIITVVLLYALFVNNGDIGYGRLNRIPYPETGIQWWHALPPLFLLVLTRFGVPVSTTFLVLTIFALTGGSSTEGVMGSMLIKSFMGYVVALGTGAVIYALISRSFEKWISATPRDSHDMKWTVLQWVSTAYLWSQWLVQDLANIFVFLPRTTETAADGTVSVSFSPGLVIFALVLMLALHALIFATRGGAIQKIVLSKTNTTDVRAATVVDFLFGSILFFFKELNDVPMSTTWVFLGLLAGREIAISYVAGLRNHVEALKDIGGDIFRVLIGLVVSVALAIILPTIATGEVPSFF